MKFLIVAATSYEIAPLLEYLDNNAQKISFFEYLYNGHTIFPFVTGVGIFMTAFNMSRFKESKSIDYAINLGVAGSFNDNLKLGQVVEVVKDKFGDLGVEESDGSFIDAHEMGLLSGDKFPFTEGWIYNDVKDPSFQSGLDKVSGITVNKVHGSQESIDAIVNKYHPDIETMEGAAFLYTIKALDIQSVQIRAISNKVEPRNKDNWELALAIDELNKWVINYFNQLAPS